MHGLKRNSSSLSIRSSSLNYFANNYGLHVSIRQSDYDKIDGDSDATLCRPYNKKYNIF